MKRLIQGTLLAIVAAVGIWGCSSDPAGQALAEKLRASEARHTRLEDDFRAVCATRDQYRRKATANEEALARVEVQARHIVDLERQREELQGELKTRTDERDVAWGQYEQFRKGMRDLLGRAEASLPGRPADIVTTPKEPTPGQLTSQPITVTADEPAAPAQPSDEPIGPPLTLGDS